MGFFELVVGLLFVLAVVDLSVGVSNDAVNFLNSAIGSRVASRRVILIIAGFGVLVGSLFSSGIMEVARKGIFNPDMFVFADVMVIFLAVMLADVLLLDMFNTFGLPTSTTVSIVFELLGASIAVAFLATIADPGGAAVLDYVNVAGAIKITSGIGLSVVIAFVVGTIVQFFSRMLFTFQEKNHTSTIQIAWGAIAFTAISYFLFVKGLKGTSFVTPDMQAFVTQNALLLMLVSVVFWAVLMWVLHQFKVDLLGAVVLGGTFSLALAFASNDLVNFVGVPLAGLSSWQAWSGSGIPPDQMLMDVLKEPVTGNTLILFGAGAIMMTTLWLSSKAKSVTQTTVNLSRQDEGEELFSPGPVSRGIVRTFVATGEAAARAIPLQWQTGIAERFAREKARSYDLERPAFDTLRASVNLTVASVLIVFATSLQLPLSTTFVSFMVAMGTSLADRAWGRDAAVYRVAGVFSVVGGWLVTAIAAFALAGLFAILIKTFNELAVVLLVILAVLALVHSHRYHMRRSRMQELMATSSPDKMDKDALALRGHFISSLGRTAEIVDEALRILIKRKRKAARRLQAAVKSNEGSTRRTEAEFVRRLHRVRPEIEPWLMNQFDVLACERDMLHSASSLASLAGEHVLNEHSPPTAAAVESLSILREHYRVAFAELAGGPADSSERRSRAPLGEVEADIDRLTNRVLEDLYTGERTTQSTSLMLGIILEMRDLQREIRRAVNW